MDLVEVKQEYEELPDPLQQIWGDEADLALHAITTKDLEENIKSDIETCNVIRIINNSKTKSKKNVTTIKDATDGESLSQDMTQCSEANIFKKPKRKTDEKNRTCPICGHISKRLSDLKVHLFVHSKVKRFQCMRCDKGYKRKMDLDVHIVNVHKNEFDDLNRVISHKIMRCSECEFQTLGIKNLQKHRLKVHEEHTLEKKYKEKEYKCGYCDYQCNFKRNLTIHQLNHTGVKRYNCKFCNNGYNVIARLEEHILHNHKHQCGDINAVISHPILECKKCPFETVDAHSFKKHILTHGDKFAKNLEQFRCDKCSYVTFFKEKLRTHVQRHLKTTVFKCPGCERSFTNKTSLDFHIMKCHAVEKPDLVKTITTKMLKCQRCHEVFRKIAGLRKHENNCA